MSTFLYCPHCGYPLENAYLCESCGAFKLGRDWHRPDRFRFFRAQDEARPKTGARP